MTNIQIRKFKKNFDKELILLCESGSKSYGFKSETSDTDIRGIFIEDNTNLLGLRSPRDTIHGFSDNRMVDWQIFEVKKFLNLLIKPNFNVIEWIYTPYQYIDIHPELKRITEMALSKKLGNHARGWAYSIYKMDWSSPKKCIYAIRPLMVYINLCETKEFESNIINLSDRFDLTDHINLLIDLYRTNHKVSETIRAKNLKIYDELVELSNIAETDSWLPIKPPEEIFNIANEFLISLRINKTGDIK